MSRYLTRKFWADQIDPAIRSAAQGFLTGAGIGAGVGEFTVLSLDTIVAGLIGGASMFALSYLFALAAGPTNGGA